jgi:hypothetical protein
VNTRCWSIGIALALGCIAVGGTARAQSPPAPRKIYTNKSAFKLPLRVDDKDRVRLQQIQLYVRLGPNAVWEKKESVSPDQKEFVFRPAQDGEHWFTVVTVDKDGKQNPPDVSQVAPELIVIVDRQPPDFEVHPLISSSSQPLLQCVIHDANPDPTKTRLEYQTPEQTWQPLEPLRDQVNTFKVPDPGALRGVVRVTAADLAGNVVTREITLQTASGSPSADTNQAPVLLNSRPEPATPSVPAATPAPKAAPRCQLINRTHTTLQYQIDQAGPSGINKVEVWMTRDEGQTWERLCEDPDHKSPADIDLPGDGVYGLVLVVCSGSGTCSPIPARGDAPDYRVEVDTTSPSAQLTGVRPGSAADAGTITITWTASDKNLKAEPIDLEYANRADGPWAPIAKGIRNDGSYRWNAPRDLTGEIYVRLSANDEAGNTTTCVAPQPLVLDRSCPKGRILGLGAGPEK